MSIINYTDEVSYRFTTLFFQLFGRGVKHIMVLDTFLPFTFEQHWKSRILDFLPLLLVLVLRLSKYLHPLEGPQVTGATPRDTVCKSELGLDYLHF